jgi:hypothetical protein
LKEKHPNNERGNYMDHYTDMLEEAEDIHDIFSLVKDAVKETLRESRAGINLGLIELGNSAKGFLGAYYPVGSNIIVMNKTPIRRITETNPSLMKPYLFSILLHEYLHSLGYFREEDTRKLTYLVSQKVFGEDHVATELSRNLNNFMPYLIYPGGFPQTENEITLIEDVDDVSYID